MERLLCFKIDFIGKSRDFITDHVTHFISHTTVYRALNVK